MKKDYLLNFPPAKLGICATIIVIFTYNILLDKHGNCTCKQQTTECNLYMCLPLLIIFVLILWMDKKFQRAWKHVCTCRCQKKESEPTSQLVEPTGQKCCRSIFLWVLIRHFIKAVLVGLLWVVSVLIDGDWFVCCKNNYPNQTQLACKDDKSIEAEERTIIAELKNKSKVSVLCQTYHSLTDQPVSS